MNRGHQHHETAFNALGFCVTIAPVVTITVQAAVAAAKKRRRKVRSQ